MRDFEIHIERNKESKESKESKKNKCEVLIEGKQATLEDLTDEELKYFYDDLKKISKRYMNVH